VSATVTVRAPRAEEVAEVVRLINEVSQREFGLDDMTEDELRRWFEQPDFDPEHNAFVVEQDGSIAAYADVSNEGNAFEQYWIDVRIPPDGSETAGEAALAAAERRAAEIASEGLEGKPARIVAGGWSVNPLMKTLLERAGYRLYRYSYRMVTDLDGEIPEPELPEGIELAHFPSGRERHVFEAVDEAFRDSHDHVPGIFEEWRHWALDRDDFDPSLWWLALDGDAIAGFCLCRPHETETDMGWVSSLGVRRPWRRRGIARALLLTSFHEFRRRGFARVGLGVDADSQTGANLLYEAAGMRPVRRYDLYEKAMA